MTYEQPRIIHGNIVHLEGEGLEWGREHFDMTIWDKGRLMNSTTQFDDRKVLRNASWTVGADWTPQEATSREVIDGDLAAHCWFRADGDIVECEAWSRQGGRISQRLQTGKRIGYFGMHTILADVLVAAARGASEPGAERPVTCITNSISDWGMGGYQAYCVSPLVTYVGPDEVEVRAGQFQAEHFRVRWSDIHPQYSDFWVTRGDFLPLRLASAYGPQHYELAALSPAPFSKS